MTRNFVLGLSAQRNEDYGPETWSLTDTADSIVDITGWTFELRIASAAGVDPSLIVTGTENSNGSVVAVSDAASGEFDVYISADDIADLPGRDIDVCTLSYNLLVTDNFGYTHAYIVGPFQVIPGV